MPPKTFSVKEVVITAAIGFLLSGIGGALVNDYFNRAKPAVLIDSVSFQGPSESIETSEELRDLAAKSHQFPLNKYESYSTLTQREAEIQENLQLLKSGLDSTTSWLTRPENSGSSANSRMTLQDEEGTPFYANSSVPGFLLAQIHMRRSGSTPPDNLAMVRRGTALGTVSQNDQGVNVDFGMSTLNFPFDAPDKDYRNWVQLLAESFAYGDRANIIHYHRVFSENVGPVIRYSEQLQSMLRDLIYSNARLSVGLLFSNSGGKLVLMKPIFGLIIEHPDFKQPFLLTTVSKSATKKENPQVRVLPVLPEHSPVPPFTIKPGESKTIQAVGLESLAKDAKKISEIYTSGLLKCRVVAFTNAGSHVESETSVFGSRINPDDLNRAQNLLQ